MTMYEHWINYFITSILQLGFCHMTRVEKNNDFFLNKINRIFLYLFDSFIYLILLNLVYTMS